MSQWLAQHMTYGEVICVAMIASLAGVAVGFFIGITTLNRVWLRRLTKYTRCRHG